MCIAEEDMSVQTQKAFFWILGQFKALWSVEVLRINLSV